MNLSDIFSNSGNAFNSYSNPTSNLQTTNIDDYSSKSWDFSQVNSNNRTYDASIKKNDTFNYQFATVMGEGGGFDMNEFFNSGPITQAAAGKFNPNKLIPYLFAALALVLVFFIIRKK